MEASGLLFGRRFELTLSPANTSNPVVLNSHRIHFQVEKSIGVDLDRAIFRIYNLSESVRKVLSRPSNPKTTKGALIQFKAGYGAKGILGNLFSGELFEVTHHREGADWLTQIRASTDHFALLQTLAPRAYSPGIKVKQIIEQECSQAGITPSFLIDLEDLVYPKGKSFCGSLKECFQELEQDHGFTITTTSESTVEVNRTGEPNGDPGIRIDSGSGLIGIPLRLLQQVNLTSLLNPRIRPGTKILLESKEVKNFGEEFICTKVKHLGDNFDEEWYSHLETVPYPPLEV